MNPEQQLRARMRDAATAIRPAGDPLAAIEHRATWIRRWRRRATMTAGALLITVTAVGLLIRADCLHA